MEAAATAAVMQQLQAQLAAQAAEMAALRQQVSAAGAPGAPVDYAAITAAVVAAVTAQGAQQRPPRDDRVSLKDLSSLRQFDSDEAAWVDWSVRARSDAAFLDAHIPTCMELAEDGVTPIQNRSLFSGKGQG